MPPARQPYAPIVPPSGDQPGNPWFYGAMTVVAGRCSPPHRGPTPAAKRPWGASTDHRLGLRRWASPAHRRTGQLHLQRLHRLQHHGRTVGACSTTTGSSPGVTTCYALDGSVLPAPSSAVGLPAGVIAFNPEVITDPDGHVRSYLAIWGGPYAGAAICHDWTTASACAGLPDPITHPTVNGGVTRDYGYTYDVPTGCMIGLGDAGVLFSMDPLTGASPCVLRRSGLAHPR
ncbi:hypothetical protein K7G98_00575 [Saccharothrix sp. MB29]|nr:hypothetical protein [Saccharothrix sp. MB29]